MNEQAKEAGTRAEELHKALYGDDTPAETPTENPVPEETLAKESEELETPVTKTETPEEPEEEKEDFEKKFKVLQGKYNAEVPRLARELREQKALVKSLNAKLEAKEATAPTVTDSEVTALNTEDFSEYDEEIQKLVKMVNTLNGTVETLNNENTLLKQTMTDVKEDTTAAKETTFLESLEAAVPDWRTINTDPTFVSWLQEMDGVSGETRQTHLDTAAESLNATNAINIFKAFNDSRPVENKADVQQNIQRQTQPDNVITPMAPTEQKRYYTRKEIKQFYKDVALRKFSPEDQRMIEADLFRAPAEGRVVG